MDLQTAIFIACEAHKDQLDKAGKPYILHPLRLMFQFDDTRLRIIAVLHDVVEDSSISLEHLAHKGFEKDILEALDCLTKRKGEEYKHFIQRLSKNTLAKAVKIEDLKDNLNVVRLESLTHIDLERLQKYHAALKILTGDS